MVYTEVADERRSLMGLDDKAKEAVGKAKEGLGDLTNNNDLKAQGLKDQAAGKAGQLADDVKDTFDKK